MNEDIGMIIDTALSFYRSHLETEARDNRRSPSLQESKHLVLIAQAKEMLMFDHMPTLKDARP